MHVEELTSPGKVDRQFYGSQLLSSLFATLADEEIAISV